MKSDLKKEDAILTEVLKALSEWNDTVVIGGGYALIAYRLYFDDKKNSTPTATRDIDSILPRKITGKHKGNIGETLIGAGFVRKFKDREQPATESYIKEIKGEEIELEFLTDKKTRGDKEINVPIAGIVAQPLSYIEMSYENILEFKTNSGIKGKIVDPAAWIFHKLLTFVKRRSRDSKYFKDIYGVWYVANELGTFSKSAVQDFKKLAKENTSWFKTAKQNADSFVSEATPEDWSKLESQDVSGKLTKASVLKIFRELGLLK